MAARWVALALMVLTIAIVGVFVGVGLRPPATLTSSNGDRVEDSTLRTGRPTGRAGAWTVTAEITESPVGAVAVILSVADADGRPAAPSVRPSATLRMADMAMGEQPVSLVQDGPGLWRGSSSLAMGGRWSLQVDIDGASASLPFEAISR